MTNWAAMHILIKRLNNCQDVLSQKIEFLNADAKICAFSFLSVVKTIWRFYSCWGGNVFKGDKERVERIVNEARRIIGVSRQAFEFVYTGLFIKGREMGCA